MIFFNCKYSNYTYKRISLHGICHVYVTLRILTATNAMIKARSPHKEITETPKGEKREKRKSAMNLLHGYGSKYQVL